MELFPYVNKRHNNLQGWDTGRKAAQCQTAHTVLSNTCQSYQCDTLRIAFNKHSPPRTLSEQLCTNTFRKPSRRHSETKGGQGRGTEGPSYAYPGPIHSGQEAAARPRSSAQREISQGNLSFSTQRVTRDQNRPSAAGSRVSQGRAGEKSPGEAVAEGPARVPARGQGHLARPGPPGALPPTAAVPGPRGHRCSPLREEPQDTPPGPPARRGRRRPRPGPDRRGAPGLTGPFLAGTGRAAGPGGRQPFQPRGARPTGTAPPRVLPLRPALPALTQLDGRVCHTPVPLPAQLALRRHLGRPLPPQAVPWPPPPRNSRDI